jgi:hypothetical protein
MTKLHFDVYKSRQGECLMFHARMINTYIVAHSTNGSRSYQRSFGRLTI